MGHDDLELPPRGLITLFRRPMILSARGMTLGERTLAWDDVAFYTYRWEDGFVDGEIYVVTRDDAWMKLDNRYYYWRQAADRVLAELHPRLRASPDYHPFRLTDAELGHAGVGSLALAEIERVEIASFGGSPRIAVIARGLRRDWSADDIEGVHDVVLLLEDLVRRGVAVQATTPLWLPPSVSDVAATLTSGVELPRAEIVRR